MQVVDTRCQMKRVGCFEGEDLIHVGSFLAGLLSKGLAVDVTLPVQRMSDVQWWVGSWERGKYSYGPR